MNILIRKLRPSVNYISSFENNSKLKPKSICRPIRLHILPFRVYSIMDKYSFPLRPHEKEKIELEKQLEEEKRVRQELKAARKETKLKRKVVKLSLSEPGPEISYFQNLTPDQPENPKSLYISVIGPPNVGKSTFINRLCKSRISAVSRKSHTTRQQITGIYTEDSTQIVVIDTPGISADKKTRILNKWLAKESWEALEDTEMAIVMFDAVKSISESEKTIIKNLEQYMAKRQEKNDPLKAILFVNKLDVYEQGHFRNKKVMPVLDRFRYHFPTLDDIFSKIFVGSSLTGQNFVDVKNYLLESAVDREWDFHSKYSTTMSDLDRTFEILREKVYRRYNKEVPYKISLECKGWGVDEQRGVTYINMDLIIPKASQKFIIFGAGGESLRGVCREAQRDIEAALNRRVTLYLNVVVRKNYKPDLIEEL